MFIVIFAVLAALTTLIFELSLGWAIVVGVICAIIGGLLEAAQDY